MFPALDISASALNAQRMRINAIAGNVANLSTTHNETGAAEAYQPRFVVFQPDDSVQAPGGARGVKVSSVQTSNLEPNYKYQPGHPDAITSGPRKGYVAYPNIDLTTEFVDALEASRAYEANVGVIEVTKSMAQQSLKIVA